MIDHGTYVEHDGRPAVRFTRRYRTPRNGCGRR
jgi:hypothetical protein